MERSRESPAAGDALRLLRRGADDQPARIVLVDDVVTKGATLAGAARRLRGAHPRASIVAFAMVRTRGLEPDIANALDPCVGVIRVVKGDAVREP